MLRRFGAVSVLVVACVALAVNGDSSWRGIEPISSLVLLDVDNTLYSEQEAGIEAQIVKNTHKFCKERIGLSAVKADELFHEYGSTIEGLRKTMWHDYDNIRLEESLQDFYENVYRDIDMTRLLTAPKSKGAGSTGYTHAQQEHRLITQLLKGCPHPVAIASNSPSKHVRKVLKYMGLHNLDLVEVLTPDRLPGFPTKHEAANFLAGSVCRQQGCRVLFFDDSEKNLSSVCHFLKGAEPVLVEAPRSSLGMCLLRKLGLVNPTFEFNSVSYLEAKNRIDSQSIHVETWNRVISNLQDKTEKQKSLEIVDLGAGRLHILSLLLQGHSSRGLHALQPNGSSISYVAYESNTELLVPCQEQLMKLGFRLEEAVSDVELLYSKDVWSIRLIFKNFDDETSSPTTAPDLLVGCCFADLVDPTVLVPSILNKFRLLEDDSSAKETLLYFPITFAGGTQFLPPKPFETTPDSDACRAVPSDTFAFQTYARALTKDMGHNLDPSLLIDEFASHGVALVAQGSSDWKIDPIASSDLYDTMLYFFGTTAGPRLLEAGLDASSWIQRTKQNRPSIHVTNIDLLFQQVRERFESNNCNNLNTPLPTTLQEIQFTAPHQVTTVKKAIPELGPNDVLIQSSTSLISSGTEVKVFKGLFDDAALDVNIKGMADERMAYPLAYGYCLVGKIVQCGSNVPEDKYQGRLAFTFAAHATYVVTSIDAVQLVPRGISAKDAIFMPSVETALSLVHDAHVTVGENVAVYGQGLIGLLVTAILFLNHHSSTRSGMYGTITTFDTIPDRLAASSRLGATQALLPGGSSGPFDVAIEVSGNAGALQSAIDSTSNGGRVIVGSWYGNTDVSLKLGMDFHRSHKTIQTSQVSELSASAKALWDKERRFGLAWELVRDLKPSKLLTRSTSLDRAMDAYHALDEGREIAIAFDY